jgi:copper homeostasis protein
LHRRTIRESLQREPTQRTLAPHERIPVTHPPPARALVEACVASPAEAMAAEAAGAGRVELCASLVEGGITPSAGLIAAVVARVSIPVTAIIRPRGGDFTYGADEVDVMLRDIALARDAAVSAIVTGALTPEGTVDVDLMRRLVEAAGPVPIAFHRAFDLTPDLPTALNQLRELGVARILTSGGARSALDGIPMLSRLVQLAGPDLAVMAGGGVRADHVAELVAGSGVREVHARPTRDVTSAVRHAGGLSFGESGPDAAAGRQELDPGGIRALVQALAG